MEFPYPILVCDIGGTNVRISAVAAPGSELATLARLKTRTFPGLAECIEKAVEDRPDLKPRSVLACGAGPVSNRRLNLTNAPWGIDGPALADRLGLSQGLLLNDFEAQALALPAYRDDWVRRIGPAKLPHAGVQLILGPGTGLGVAALVETDGRFLPLASEAAHASFGPGDAEDERVWPHFERVHGRITAEAVISGPGSRVFITRANRHLGRLETCWTASKWWRAPMRTRAVPRPRRSGTSGGCAAGWRATWRWPSWHAAE